MGDDLASDTLNLMHGRLVSSLYGDGCANPLGENPEHEMGLFGNKQRSYEDDPEYQRWLKDAQEYDVENRRLQTQWAAREAEYIDRKEERDAIFETDKQQSEEWGKLLKRHAQLLDESFELLETFRAAAIRLNDVLESLESRSGRDSDEGT